jgi:hypothetical protein
MSRIAVVIALFGCLAAPLFAGPMKAEFDFADRVAQLKSHFRPYNHEGQQAIYFEPTGVRFWLGTPMKKPKQVGLYTPIKLVGDFEITVRYEWLGDAEPTTGYGVSCGIAIGHQGKIIQVVRGNKVKKGNFYWVTEGIPKPNGPPEFKDREERHTRAKSGRLALRREKNTILCLVADGDETLEEVDRITKFTTDSIHEVRFIADPGESPTVVDARLKEIRFRAEDILSDVPLRERQSSLGWWLSAAGVVVVIGLSVLLFKRYRNRES